MGEAYGDAATGMLIAEQISDPMSKRSPMLKIKRLLLLPLFYVVGNIPYTFAVEEAVSMQSQIDQAAAASQNRINDLDDQTALDLQRYRLSVQRKESLEIYTRQLQKLIDSQVSEIDSVKRQTREIDDIETGSLPLMIEMTDTLDQIVAADVPFLIADREERVEKLRNLIDRADVTAGEKFRRIMEAYLIEVDFGRTIEAYRGEIENEGNVRTVDFLRIGRIGLFYQTLDGAESGRWNLATGQWTVIEGPARRQIQVGLRIARKQAPPEMLTLPIKAPGA